MKEGILLTKKLWFQASVFIILALFSIKLFLEINWLLNPILVIFRTIMIPLIIGGVLFYIFVPLQRILETSGMKRWASITTIVTLFIALVVAFVVIIGTPISNQLERLIENAPQIATSIQLTTDKFVVGLENLPPEAIEIIKNTFDSLSMSIQSYAITISSSIVSIISGAVSSIFTALLIPFFFIYMLKDHEKFAPMITNIFTGKTKEWLSKTLSDINNVLGTYVQGQILISFILACMFYVGYVIIHLEYSLLLAMFAFIMSMIPFLGAWLSFIPAIIIAWIQDPILVVWVIVITVVAQQIEGNLITPNIMGKSLDIHPLTVISIVLAAGKIAGFIGILIAIPTYAVIKAVVINIYKGKKDIKEVLTKDV